MTTTRARLLPVRVTAFAAACTAAGAFSALFFVWLLLSIGGARVTEAVDDLGEAVPALAAALACWVATRRKAGQARLGWRLLGVSALCWGVGEAIWSYYEVLLGRQVPFPSVADAGFLLAVPFALAGMLAFSPAPMSVTSRVRTGVDALIVGSTTLLISWLLVLGPAYHAGTGSLLAQMIALAYPLGDVVILSAVVIVAGGRGGGERVPFAWIAVAMTALAVSDSAFAWLSQEGSYGSAQLVDAGWVVGYSILALAAIKPTPTGAARAHRGERTLLAYVPVAVAVAIVGVNAAGGQGLTTFGRWNFLAVVVFIVVRQILALHENRAIMRGLEAKVAARTLALRDSEQRLRSLIQNVSDVISVVAADGTIVYVSPSVRDVLGYEDGELVGASLLELVHPEDRARAVLALTDRPRDGTARRPFELRIRGRDGSWRETETTAGHASGSHTTDRLVLTTRDVTERRRLEFELRLAQKLESIGQLAAGIAHEINTPLQFVGDTGRFLTDAFSDILDVLHAYDELRTAADGAVSAGMLERIAELEDAADICYLREGVPAALERSAIGVRRMAEIVGAMRAFASPPSLDTAHADINDAIQNTLIVARNEYKYVADVSTDLADLPAVECNVGEICQVLINLIVNAAHAIADVVGESGRRGAIRVRTRTNDEEVSIAIEDTGSGIPEDVADRVFDPFFTTKEVGRGTGQGLAIARSIVVDRHGGALSFTTEPGEGTTFEVRLPLTTDGRRRAADVGHLSICRSGPPVDL